MCVPVEERPASSLDDRASAGSRIVAAIEEATDLLREEGLESKRLTVRTYRPRPPRATIGPTTSSGCREMLGASQAVLAGFLGVNVNTVRSWEQGKRPPQAIARRFLAEIESDPAYWRRRIGAGDRRLPTRGAERLERRRRKSASIQDFPGSALRFLG